ncbi:hypothetical protein [Halarchaeum sp. CBA1220]|uniref:hypothetical protein n=1 Tax=Halarchaeum sp. CBA1220 TaxID=1853682 RepID=UPI0021070064|nr:hypothetical protein [Halarchaeum sp. CBA1220]
MSERARRTLALCAVTVAVSAAVASAAPTLLVPRYPPGVFGVLVGLKLFFSTATLTSLCALLVTHARLYRDVPTPFARGLLLFTLAFLLYAATSNPLLPLLFGFGPPDPIGAFTFLPDLFACLAALTLYHQSAT